MSNLPLPMMKLLPLNVVVWLCLAGVWALVPGYGDVNAAAAMRAAEIRLQSPNGNIVVTIQSPPPGSRERWRWSAAFHGKRLFTNCETGLELGGATDPFLGSKLVRERKRSMDKSIPVLFGKADHANDRFRETRLTLEASDGHRADLVFRCYNDAIALRYELPENAPARSLTVLDEATSFGVEGAPTAYVQVLENYKTSHEHGVKETAYDQVPRGALLDVPLTLRWADGTVAAITEAALRRYAGMALMAKGKDGSPVRLVSKLTPRPDGTKVVGALPLRTPWRVVLLGERPGALLESTTVYCLNEPPAFKDLAWIKPGKITFSWWNGDVYDGQPGPPILSFEMAKRYIDFCARHGIATHSLTSTENTVTPWYYQTKAGVEPGPDTDVTRPRPGFELAEIRSYAASKNVRLWTWVHQGALRGRVEEAFAAFEKLGWSGMMVDFFDHDDQDAIEFAESILAAAARHHILIHLHGVWKPTGLERTFPNLMNHEGALNLEYLKWSDRCTPEHNLMMAFTRLVAGPMDYHLGGFRAVTRAEFKPRNVGPNVLGTRCHHLAMYVCFDNPNPMVADYPAAYEGQLGFDFVKIVPTWWDETRVLAAEVGEVLVSARRKGKTWYVGGLSARRARDLELPLSFVGTGRYQIKIWKDAPDAETAPNHLVTETSLVSRADTLRVHVALEGGFVAELNPVVKGGAERVPPRY